jgi:hypothetical protein
VHLGDSFFEEGGALLQARRKQREWFRAQCKRKLGASAEATESAPRKRRRVKSYLSLLMIDNALRVTAGARITDFKIDKDAATGAPVGSPFTWKSLSLATDSGPDMVLPSAAWPLFFASRPCSHPRAAEYWG